MILLSLDVGSTETGYVFLDTKTRLPIETNKILNTDLVDMVRNREYDEFVIEQFESYGMSVGKTTFQAIEWNGRFIQLVIDRGLEVNRITRKEEKLALCFSMKANDTTIRHALIDRFAKFDFRSGKGTKKNKDFFYGFKKDCWSAYAVATTYLDKKRLNNINKLLTHSTSM